MREQGTIDLFFDHCCRSNPLVKKFFSKSQKAISVSALRKFARFYWDEKEKNNSGAKFSERVFACWIANKLSQGNYSKEITLHDMIEIPVPTGENTRRTVPKRVDLTFLGRNDEKVVFEFKCNIDMIEKYLYKFYLFAQYLPLKTYLLIWETYDNRNCSDGQESHYVSLLEHAKCTALIEDYFYFPIWDKGDRYVRKALLEKEIERLKDTIATLV